MIGSQTYYSGYLNDQAVYGSSRQTGSRTYTNITAGYETYSGSTYEIGSRSYSNWCKGLSSFDAADRIVRSHYAQHGRDLHDPAPRELLLHDSAERVSGYDATGRLLRVHVGNVAGVQIAVHDLFGGEASLLIARRKM